MIGLRITVISMLLVLVGACSAVYHEPQDGGPPVPVDVSHIHDARPSPVVRTRAGNASVYTVLGKTYKVKSDSQGYRQRGMASWYGTKFHGRRTANGEVYDMYAMTAAHKTLPIPSYVRVTHVGNGRSIVVRINDRGPFHSDRIIDLSYTAARKLGVDTTGVALVDVVDVTPSARQAVTKPAVYSPVDGLEFYLQLGAFQQRQSALSLQNKVKSVLTEPVNIVEGSDKLHRVKVGPVDNEESILGLQRLLQNRGIQKGYVVHK